MRRMCQRDEGAVTPLELIVFIIVLVGVGSLVLVQEQGSPAAGSGDGHGGLLTLIPGGTGKYLHVVGSTTAFSATNNNPPDVQAIYPVPDPGRMGSLESTVALFIGNSGSVDFDRITLVWISNGTTSVIPRKDSRPLSCPGWTIAGKYNVIPMKLANGNNILEPGEQFLIFICPDTPLAAYQQFTIRVEDSGGIQSPFLGGAAPVMNHPVMSLL